MVSHLFASLAYSVSNKLPKDHKAQYPLLIDSMTIISAHSGRRFNAKVALEIAINNGYYVTKKLHYHGIRLHSAASYTKGSLPIPAHFGITDAGTPDIMFYE